MSVKKLTWLTLVIAVLMASAPAGVAQANAPAPPERIAFQFYNTSGQRVMPASLQLAACAVAGHPGQQRQPGAGPGSALNRPIERS